MPYRICLTQYHRCNVCHLEWPRFIRNEGQKIRKFSFPCPECVAKRGIDVVALLLEEPRVDDEEEDGQEDFHVVAPANEAEEE